MRAQVMGGWLAVLAAGCGPGRPEHTVVAVVPAPAQAASTQVEPEAPPRPEASPNALPAKVKRPAPACSYAHDDLRDVRLHPSLQLEPGGDTWAMVMGRDPTKGTVVVPRGSDARSVALSLAMREVTLDAWVPSEQVPLFATRTVLIGDVVAPRVLTRLRWARARRGWIRLAYRLEDPPLKAPVRIEGEVTCTDVSLERGSFRPRRELTKGLKPRRRMLPFRKPVGLRASISSKPVLTLEATTQAWRYVDLLETRGPDARILIGRRSEVIVGWVPTAALSVPSGGVGRGFPGYGDRGALRSRRALPKHPTVRCMTDLPFAVAIGKSEATVGTITAGTLIERLPGKGALQTVHVHGWPLRVMSAARVLASRADLDRCKPTKVDE